ncbi:hypothetical protein LAZ67_3000102, partial [Cordylochernes scorpioides]
MEREEALERLKKKRTILRTSLSKYGKRIEEYDVHKECDHEELLGQLSDVYEELRRVDEEIGKLIDIKDLEKDLKMVEEYREKAVAWKYLLKKRSLVVAEGMQRETATATKKEYPGEIGRPTLTGMVKLPKLTMDMRICDGSSLEIGMSEKPSVVGVTLMKGVDPASIKEDAEMVVSSEQMVKEPSKQIAVEESNKAQVVRERCAEDGEKAQVKKKSVVEVDESNRAEVEKESVEADKEKVLDVEQGMDSKNTEEVKLLYVKQGTDLRMAERPYAEQGNEPKEDGVQDSENEPKGDGVKDSEAETKDNEVEDSGTAIEACESVSNSKAVAEGADQVEIADGEAESIDDIEERVVRIPASSKLMEAGQIGDAEFKVKGYYLPDRPVCGCDSRAAPVRPAKDGASYQGRNGFSLKRYMKRIHSLLRRIPEIRIKLRRNKFGVVADLKRYFQMIAIRDNDWDYLKFLWKKKRWTTDGKKDQYYFRFSNYYKILRVTAWMNRFLTNARGTIGQRVKGDLTVNEIKRAELMLVRVIQRESFTGPEDKRVLRQETRRRSKTRPIKVGDLVLIGQDNAKRVNWPLARVVEVYPGRDGPVRVAKLRTSKGVQIRPVQRLYNLEIPADLGSTLRSIQSEPRRGGSRGEASLNICGEPARMETQGDFANLKTLKELRTPRRIIFTKKINEVLEELKGVSPDEGLLMKRKEFVVQHYQQIKEFNRKIEIEIIRAEEHDEKAVLKELESTSLYEEMYNDVLVEINKILEAKTEEKRAMSEAGSEGSRRALLRLPKMELPCFDGDLEGWISWWSRFKRIHEDRELDDDEKMHYLVQAMVPGSRAHRLLGAYTHTGKNYESAIGALKGRFGDKKLLIELYLRKLINLVVLNARRQSANLDRLYDEISAYLQSLESLSIPSEYLEVFLFPLVESCLPTEILQVWQRIPEAGYGRDDEQEVEQGKGDRLKALMGFLRAEIKAQQRINISRIGVGENNPKYNFPSRPLHFNKSDKSTASQLCVSKNKEYNQKDHFRPRTTREKPSASSVMNCRGPHYLIFCRGNNSRRNSISEDEGSSQERKSNSSVQNQRSTVLLTQSCASEVLSMTVRAEICGSEASRIINVLLDSGSQYSFIKESLAEELGLEKLGERKLTKCLFGGRQTKEEKHSLYSFSITNILKEETVQVKAMGQRMICDRVPILTAGTWMRDLDKKGVTLIRKKNVETSEIDLLLGADNLSKIWTDQVVCLEDGLTAINTKIGWSIFGEISLKEGLASEYASPVFLTMSHNIKDLRNLEMSGVRDPVENISQGKKAQVERKSVVEESEKSQVEKNSVVETEESHKTEVERKSVVEESEKDQVEKNSVVETEESHKTEVERKSVVEESEKDQVEKNSVVETEESHKTEVERKSVVEESEKDQVEKNSVVETEESHKTEVERKSVVEESEKSQVEKRSVVEVDESHKAEIDKMSVIETESAEPLTKEEDVIAGSGMEPKDALVHGANARDDICDILGPLGPVLPDARRTSMSTLPCSRGGRRHSWAK